METMIKIQEDFGLYKNKCFGPFTSMESAVEALKKNGCTLNINNRNDKTDVWYCQTSMHGVATVRIVPLDPIMQLPVHILK